MRGWKRAHVNRHRYGAGRTLSTVVGLVRLGVERLPVPFLFRFTTVLTLCCPPLQVGSIDCWC